MIWEFNTLLVESSLEVRNLPHWWLCNLKTHYSCFFYDVEPQPSFSLLYFFYCSQWIEILIMCSWNLNFYSKLYIMIIYLIKDDYNKLFIPHLAVNCFHSNWFIAISSLSFHKLVSLIFNSVKWSLWSVHWSRDLMNL